MKLSRAILMIALLALQACDQNGEEEPRPQAFLTVTLAANYLATDVMWVFATDATGQVLDAGPVSPGSSLILESFSPPEFIDLTTHTKGSVYPVNHLFYSYQGIKTGSEITFQRPQSSGGLTPVTGKATINIQNCTPYGNFVLSDGLAHLRLYSQANTHIQGLIDLREDASDILVSSHMAIDKPVYAWVDNVTDAGVYTTDFNNFTDFPKDISVKFYESMSALIFGRKADAGGEGYAMTNTGFSTDSPNGTLAKLGYLDGFDEYECFVASTNDKADYYRTIYYHKSGTTLPQEIALPDNLLTVQDPSIGNFSFDYSSTYTYRSHYWRHEASDHTVHWLVFTDKPTTTPINELPQALITEYPYLSVENLEYVLSEFYHRKDGFTYDQFLFDALAGSSPMQREYYSESFRPK